MAQSQVFHSVHYSGEDLVLKFGPNEPWKKVFGPIFIYLNSLTDEDDPNWLWENAKEQVSHVKIAILFGEN
jgi:rhamnogalacturonan endolyase